MRRRRLIGMYRVLLKSMNLVCSDGQEITTHDGAAAEAWNLNLATRNRTRTGPFGNLSDWPIQHNRLGPSGPNLYRLACGLTARCLADSPPLSRSRSGPPQRRAGLPFRQGLEP